MADDNYTLEYLARNTTVRAALKPIKLTLFQLAPVFTKPITTANGGTNTKDYTQGDIFIGIGGGTVGKLPIGPAGHILRVQNGVGWSNILNEIKDDFVTHDLLQEYTNTNNEMIFLKQRFIDEGFTVRDLGQQLSYITGQIAIASASVNNNQGLLTAQLARVATLQNAMLSVNASVVDLEGRLTTMRTSIAGVDSEFDVQNTSMNTLQASTSTLDDDINVAEAGITNNTMFKNALVNGGFTIWQRGTYFSGRNTKMHLTADHWSHSTTHNGTLTTQKGASVVNNINVSTLLLSLAGNTGGFTLQNVVEDVRSIQNQTCTASIWVRDTAVTPFTLNVYQYYGATVTVASVNAQSSTGWTQVSTTFLMPSLVGVSFPPDVATSIIFSVEVAANVDFSGLEFAMAQLERGGTVTPFGERPYQMELGLCRRYYETGFVCFTGQASADLGVSTSFNFLVSKAYTPAMTFQIQSSSGFKTTNSVGFVNQAETSSIRVTKDTTSGYGMFMARYYAESEI